ncbi:hypothetical protein BTZ20_5550 [Rhodococcus sp. MTM3W5.2]|nr:hypothetical protein BTZ20_5550 [Rhodococcus sp. MTM3W5.2]
MAVTGLGTGVFERGHLRCTAFEYRSNSRESGSYFCFRME